MSEPTTQPDSTDQVNHPASGIPRWLPRALSPQAAAALSAPRSPAGSDGATGSEIANLGGMSYPGMPADARVSTPTALSGFSADDPAGLGPVAYTVHLDSLGSTLRQAEPAQPLDQSTVELMRAGLRLTSSLQIPDALRNLVDSACALTGATWGTITVEDRSRSTGRPSDPVVSGDATASPEVLESLLGSQESDTEVVIVNEIIGASAFTGQIEGEGPGSILSVPLRAHGRVYGRMYLCDKPGGFGPADTTTVITLAEAAAVAVENSRLYRVARTREKWMAIAQELTTMLLSGAEEDDALTLIAQRVRQVAHAATSVLILPSIGDTWVCEIADGDHAGELIGVPFPPEGRALQTLALQTGLTVPSLAQVAATEGLRVPVLAQFGPALYAPMLHRGRGVGVMLLLREQGAPPFSEQDLEIAELFAGQATMAFELADAQHAEEMATLLDERARIARDLHDLAIQQLFAAGMQVTAVQDRLRSGLDADWGNPERTVVFTCQALEQVLGAIDDSVSQIRSIVRRLRDRDEEVSLVERLRREASLARTSLGYAPSLLLSVDGQSLSEADRDAEDELIDAIDAAVDPDVADDVVAVVREGLSNVARHARASSVTVDITMRGVLPAGMRQEPRRQAWSSDLEAGHQQSHRSGQATDRHNSRHGGEDRTAWQPTGSHWDGRSMVQVVCQDDGVGMDPQVTRSSGTANMAERARRHAGTFTIGPARPDQAQRCGTRFVWTVPLEPEATASPSQ